MKKLLHTFLIFAVFAFILTFSACPPGNGPGPDEDIVEVGKEWRPVPNPRFGTSAINAIGGGY